MALQSPFFGNNKRENEPLHSRTATLPGQSVGTSSLTPGVSPGASVNSSARPVETPAVATPVEGGSKLIVGPNIKLKGVEITDCDTLVVEGLVEATMDSRVMQIAQQGAFKGSAEIDIAEIHGSFDGDLVVRDKLIIYATGKVTGKIRYGKVVIEEGGQLSGEVSFGASTKGASASGKPALAAA